MIARYHGHDVDLNGLRQRLSLSLTGAPLRALMDLAHQLGFTARALRAEVDALSGLRGPAVLHWDLNHFVVLGSMRRGRWVIHDPAVGRRVLPLAEVSRHFTGVVLEVTPVAAFEPISARLKTRFRDLWSRIEGFWPALAQVLLLSVVLQVAVFAAPFYLQLTVDEAIQRGDAELLPVLAIGFGGLAVIQAAVTALRAWTLQSIGCLLSFQLTGNIVHHLLRLRTAFFEKRHVGDILSRLGSVEPLRDALTRGVVSTVIDGAMAVVAAVILFMYSPRLALLVVGAVTLGLALTFALYPAQRLRTEEQIVASAREQSHLIESVRASTIVKVMGREPERESVWRNRFADVTNATFAVGRLSIVMTAGQQFVTGLQHVLVVYLAARAILSGAGFSVGMLFAFLSYRQTFTDRSMALVNQLVQFSYLRLHLDRIGDIVHAERDAQDGAVVPSAEMQGRIAVRSVSFRYGTADHLVLEDVDLDVPAGALVALTGPSGGGKTTLLKLLLGLYAPTAGEIQLDGHVANPAVWPSWRARVGVVAQEDQLLSGTVADNVAFFDPQLDMRRVQKACIAARVHEDILRLPMQYLSLVGDMGSTLSGGQRQRLLLARALYRRPRLLFLDEGTAHLDPDTETRIVELIAGLPMTRIVVAHRPALVEAADAVYRVAGGRVARVKPRAA